MSAQELADLESLYADGVLDEDEYKTKLAELTPKKERTRADELADLEALKNDGILDDDEYKAKLAELQDDEPATKKAKTEEEDYEQLTVTKLKAKSKERGLAATGEKGILIWRLKLKDRHASVRCSDGADPFSFRGAALKKAAARHGVNCMGSPEEMLEGIVKKLAADAPQKPALEDDGSQDAIKAATRVLELAAEDAWEEILSLGAPGKTLTAVWKSTSASGARRWRGGRRGDSGRTRCKFDFHTGRRPPRQRGRERRRPDDARRARRLPPRHVPRCVEINQCVGSCAGSVER